MSGVARSSKFIFTIWGVLHGLRSSESRRRTDARWESSPARVNCNSSGRQEAVAASELSHSIITES